MPSTTIVFGPFGLPIRGEYLSDPTETDTSALQNILVALGSVWHYPEFWHRDGYHEEAILWNPERMDAPARFRPTDGSKASGELYTTQIGRMEWNVDIAQGMMLYKLACHLGGHRFQDVYGTWNGDDAGQEITEFLRRNGAGDIETAASAMGDVFMHRIGLPTDNPPFPGLDALMEAHRLARMT